MRGREQSFVRVSGGIVTEHFASLLQDEKHGFEYARPVTFVRPWREEDLPPMRRPASRHADPPSPPAPEHRAADPVPGAARAALLAGAGLSLLWFSRVP